MNKDNNYLSRKLEEMMLLESLEWNTVELRYAVGKEAQKHIDNMRDLLDQLEGFHNGKQTTNE